MIVQSNSIIYFFQQYNVFNVTRLSNQNQLGNDHISCNSKLQSITKQIANMIASINTNAAFIVFYISGLDFQYTFIIRSICLANMDGNVILRRPPS